MATEQLTKQVEIAKSGFRREELGRQDPARGIVLHAQGGESWTTTFEPVMRATIELDQFAESSGTYTALAMSRRPTLSGWAETLLAQEPAQCLAAEREAFALDELLGEMVIVEADVGAACQTH